VKLKILVSIILLKHTPSHVAVGIILLDIIFLQYIYVQSVVIYKHLVFEEYKQILASIL